MPEPVSLLRIFDLVWPNAEDPGGSIGQLATQESFVKPMFKYVVIMATLNPAS